ncbi:MAG: hypothetical protein ACYDHH_11545 [Solirubrobacteraceae bacterium]
MAVIATLLALSVGAPSAGAAATASGCGPYAAVHSAPAILALDPHPHAPRVFAMQFAQSPRYVVSYASFAAKIDCMLREYVLPHLARHRPNVVVFNEDIGLATIATGARGALARALFTQPNSLSCEPLGVPCATLAALTTITTQYAVPLAAYHLRFPSLSGLGQGFVAATDTVVRSFMDAFSSLAKRYGIYLIGSADFSPFTQSTEPADIALFGDPSAKPRPTSVYVATAPEVYNEVLMWGPHDVRSTGPDVMRNVVASNLKTPLTPLETGLGFTPGPSTGPAAVANLAPYAIPGTRARLGFATSLPAFTYGSPATGVDPCSNTSRYYMRCLNRLGANVVIQDEANPGRWTGADGNGIERWQPMSWMSSAYRAVSDPTVGFAYAVNPMMVGNLADLVFDGQSAILQRGLRAGRAGRAGRAAGCHYVGNGAFLPGEDQTQFESYAGPQPDFLALAPWVVPDAARGSLRAVGAQLAPGSRSPIEDHYLETALIADLPFPADRHRAGC